MKRQTSLCASPVWLNSQIYRRLQWYPVNKSFFFFIFMWCFFFFPHLILHSFFPRNEQEDKPHSINSSAPNSLPTSLGRIADNHVLLSSRVLLTSARKLSSHRRLPSLTSDQLSSKAPNMYNDEILRGTKLWVFSFYFLLSPELYWTFTTEGFRKILEN